jgi:lipopolysaccharide transport protein LptA
MGGEDVTRALALVPAITALWLASAALGEESPPLEPRSRATDVSIDLWLDGVPAIRVDAASLDQAEGQRLELRRPRIAVGEELRLAADDGVARLDGGALEASGAVDATLDAGEPVEIRADRFSVDVRAGTGVFDGAVEVTQGTLVLMCEHLEVAYDRETDEIRSVTASGGVEIRQGDRLGRGDEAVFDREAGAVELRGSPYLEEGNVRLRGQVIRFRVDGGEISCTGCRAVFGGAP